ncbi:MAG: hypothetical protein ACTS6G_02395 [Candidatus Hodgkinia cicadicola]
MARNSCFNFNWLKSVWTKFDGKFNVLMNILRFQCCNINEGWKVNLALWNVRTLVVGNSPSEMLMKCDKVKRKI